MCVSFFFLYFNFLSFFFCACNLGMESEHNGHLPVSSSQVTEQHTASAGATRLDSEQSEDLDPSEMKDKDTEKGQKQGENPSNIASKTKEAKERENKKRERSPKQDEAGDKASTSPQKATGEPLITCDSIAS